jgi:hypothetical protein
MSKNTNIAELINYISVDGSGNVVLSTGQLVATQNYVGTAISNLVASAPSTLDTLNELATALGNDANFATTVATSIGTKQAQLNGTGFVKISGTTISYDNSTYLTSASLTGYIPYTGASTAVDLGTNDITSRYVVAAGSPALGGVISMRQDAAYLAKGNGYSSIASSFTEFDFFGYTGASTYKNFTLKFDGLTNNTRRRYTLPDSDGTLALTSNLSSYLPLAGGTLTGALSGTSATFSGDMSAVDVYATGAVRYNGAGLNASDKKLYSPVDGELQWMTHSSAGAHAFSISHQGTRQVYLDVSGNSYFTGGNVGIGLINPQAILDVSHTAGTTNIIRVSNGAGNYRWRVDQAFSMIMTNASGVDTFSVNTSGAGIFSSSLTAQSGVFEKPFATNGTSLIVRQTTAGGNGNQDIGLLVDIQGANDDDRIANFRYYDGSTFTSRMVIKRGGSVGIGTTTPSHRLHVYDNSGSGVRGLRIVTDSSTVGPTIRMDYGPGGLRNWLIGTSYEYSNDFEIRVSNANSGDPGADGSSRFILWADGGYSNTSRSIGNLSSTSLAGFSSANVQRWSFSSLTDNNWRTLVSNVNGIHGVLKISGTDAGTKNYGEWFITFSFPAYGVSNFAQLHYSGGGWNTGGFELTYSNTGSAYFLQFRCTSYYSGGNTAGYNMEFTAL